MGLKMTVQARRDVLQQIASQYHEASVSHKGELLDDLVAQTGYARRYSIWLLNHPEETSTPRPRTRRGLYGSDVQHALYLLWHMNNRLCTKRLIPFLPTLIDALERHGHLHLTEECRRRLLSMSAATADRLLSSYRAQGQRGLSTTRAGTYLKSQIPLRTFTDWNDTQPGFLEADLVAHCGSQQQGSYLYTLTLTDIATGWTECLPLLHRSPEAVVAAFERARTRFPFPILGLDTDNGGEFINEKLLAYCEREHITFTRGRPYLKNDQCYVEQKNGNVVRQTVGDDRLFGLHVYRQLDELYSALHLYGNVFQPSVKLVATQREGKRVRRIHDAAKSPLQRVLLSQSVPADKQQELRDLAYALDPLRLFQQVERLQQALFCCVLDASRSPDHVSARPILIFTLSECATGISPAHEFRFEPAEMLHKMRELYAKKYCVAWRSTKNDPFVGMWEQIASWVIAHPQRSAGEIFRDVQRLEPGRYHPCQLRTLERGVRKIRSRLQDIMEAFRQEERVHGHLPPLVSHEPPEEQAVSLVEHSALPTPQREMKECVAVAHPMLDKALLPPQETALSLQETPLPLDELSQQEPSSCGVARRDEMRQSHATMTIVHAIRDYLEVQQREGRRPKTIEWHQTALALFEQYLRTECHCVLLTEITEKQVCDWVAWLGRTPTDRGKVRLTSTMESYARSARAWCQWLVDQHYLKQTPFASLTLPKGGNRPVHPIEAEEWERLLVACRTPRKVGVVAEQVRARNAAILWILFETGMHLSEVCGLRLADVNVHDGMLRVQGRGSQERRSMLGGQGVQAVRVYMEKHRLKSGARVGKQDSLFLSERGRPLTANAFSQVFERLKKQAGITRKETVPSLLRDSFAVRYLHMGGDLFSLREVLGQEESAVVKRFIWVSDEARKTFLHQENEVAQRPCFEW